MPKLRLPWGEVIHIEDMERFAMDVMNLTGEYFVEMPTCHMVTITADAFHLDPDEPGTIVVRSCKVRFVEQWPEDDEEDAEFEQKWKDFMLVEDPAQDRLDLDDRA